MQCGQGIPTTGCDTVGTPRRRGVGAIAPGLVAGTSVFAALEPGTMVLLLHPSGEPIELVACAIADQTDLPFVTVLYACPPGRPAPAVTLNRAQLKKSGPAWASIGRALAQNGVFKRDYVTTHLDMADPADQ